MRVKVKMRRLPTSMISLPLKETVGTNIREKVTEHIHLRHPETHPNNFKWDIDEWESLRAAYERVLATPKVKVGDLDVVTKYHAQLVFILTKLPPDIGLSFLYSPSFVPDAPQRRLNSLLFERFNVLYNLAAIYSHLACSESRSAVEGIKRASAWYQNSAAILAYLRTDLLTPLLQSLDENTLAGLLDPYTTPEYEGNALKGLEECMLAQAQECAWQLSTSPSQSYAPSILARIAAATAQLYSNSLTTLSETPFFSATSITSPTPPLTPSLTLQSLHFTAVSQYRKSLADHTSHKYGDEITRLSLALASAQKALAQSNSQALKQKNAYKTGPLFVKTLGSELALAKKDNDYIYNQNPTPESRLSEIEPFNMVKLVMPAGVEDVQREGWKERMCFGELMGWGGSVAVEIYEDRRENWINDEIREPLKLLAGRITDTLTNLSLPASLDALSRPIGLPPSLLRKAEEVRQDEGSEKLRILLENVENVRDGVAALLNEALDILDQEASEDEAFPMLQPSHEANAHLTAKAAKYRETLDLARESDEIVRSKWEECEDDVELLSLDQRDLETIVPYSTGGAAANARATTTQVRTIRALLEELGETQASSDSILARVEQRSRTDDIRERVMKEARGMETWVSPGGGECAGGVEPGMFEGLLENEMEKYVTYKDEVVALEGGVEELLAKITERNTAFLASREQDKSVRDRARMLQKLDVAYHKYKELLGNMEEGLKFYNDLGLILSAFKEECKEWVYDRRESMRNLTNDQLGSLGGMNLNDDPLPEEVYDSEEEVANDGGPAAARREPAPNGVTAPIPARPNSTAKGTTQVKSRSSARIKAQDSNPQSLRSTAGPARPPVQAQPSSPPPPPQTQKKRIPGPPPPSLHSAAWEGVVLPEPPNASPGVGEGRGKSRVKKKAEVA